MDYHKYIASAAWDAKRLERLEIDGHKCAVCGSTEGLQVHHLTYANLGNEDARNDLITACTYHHRLLDTLERFQRYARRKHDTGVLRDVPFRQEAKNHGLAHTTVQVDFIERHAVSQRTDGKSVEQVGKIDETDFLQARQNRRRL